MGRFFQLLSVFDDVRKEIRYVYAGGADHLGDEGCAGHTRDGVDLKEVQPILGEDVVHSHQAGAVEILVDAGRGGLHKLHDILRCLGGAHLAAVAVILGVVVEILILRDDFDDGQPTTAKRK